MYVPVSVKESLKSLGSSSRWLKMELLSQLQQLHDLSNLTLEDKTCCPPAMGPGFLRNNNPLSEGCEIYILVTLRVDRNEQQGKKRKMRFSSAPQPKPLVPKIKCYPP
jgi:hypothetical protein